MSVQDIKLTHEQEKEEQTLYGLSSKGRVIWVNDEPRLVLPDDLSEYEIRIRDKYLRKGDDGYYDLPPRL